MSDIAFPKLLLFLLATCFLSNAALAQETLPPLSPDGQPACFGRVYDAAHMRAHPNQKITRIFWFFGDRPVGGFEEEPPSMMASSYNSFLATTVRGASKPEWISGDCHTYTPEEGGPPRISCITDCDRGLASLVPDAGGEGLTLEGLPPGIYLGPDEMEGITDAEYKRLSFGADDDNFHLDREPVQTCMAEFGRIAPRDPALGQPLRVRLKPDQPFCYGRDYTARHLTTHPDQVTRSIRLYRGPAEMAFRDDIEPERWPTAAMVTVSVTTRGEAAPAEKSFSCDGDGNQWRCMLPSSEHGVCDTYISKWIYLHAGREDSLLLSNPESSLPIVDMCSIEAKTGSDDKLFRLYPMPLSACGL